MSFWREIVLKPIRRNRESGFDSLYECMLMHLVGRLDFLIMLNADHTEVIIFS
jgi:hypothetical protein